MVVTVLEQFAKFAVVHGGDRRHQQQGKVLHGEIRTELAVSAGRSGVQRAMTPA